MMKKFLALLLTVLMVATLAACGAKPAEGADAGKDDAGAAKTLSIATSVDFPPYEFYEGEKPVGIDIEIAAAIAEKLGRELHVEDTQFGSIINAVDSGKVDMGMSGMTITDERKQSVDFSDPYTTAVQSVIVAEGSPITTVDDLYKEGANCIVGVQESTTGDLYISGDAENPDNAAAGLTVERYAKGTDAVQSLIAGKIGCVIIDDQVAKAFVKANTGLKILDSAYANEEYAICFKKGSPLTAEVNAALKTLIDDGTVQTIIDKYIAD